MEAKSFGEFLKTERELRNISLEELASITRINIRYLKAIEDNEFHILPAETFVKGFIKSYAKHIGLDEDDVMLNYEFYAKQQKNGNDSSLSGETDTMSASRKLIIIVLLLVFLLIFVIILAYYLNRFSSSNPDEGAHPRGESSFICQEYPGQSGSIINAFARNNIEIVDWEY